MAKTGDQRRVAAWKGAALLEGIKDGMADETQRLLWNKMGEKIVIFYSDICSNTSHGCPWLPGSLPA
ncbi:MAG: hypothetical protein ACK6BM_15695 [Cyanobacteriota bacterium]|jgi:hypothetical protein